MKKIALLLLMFVTFQVSAQDFHFLPKIGLNLANMTNTDGSMKPELNVGVAAEFPINPQFSVEPGIYYSMQGTKGSDGGATAKIKNDYLNIPIYAKAYMYKGLYAFAGPQFGFLVGSKISASEGKFSGSVKAKEMFNKVDVALGIGLGYQFESGLLFSMNYNIGLTNTLSDNKMSVGGSTLDWGGEKSRNGVLQINVGWRF
ncbi:porin family protein [uncultured Parabacteroides sp.]|jgi:hypothetical protein|uniref:porin family protein n=1 Tax=uncultured Parabacteroides sp. TaxID=512312 RepID=UPI0025F84F6C|nr:porin family protein [uncultured Parabacteroides sp.]